MARLLGLHLALGLLFPRGMKLETPSPGARLAPAIVRPNRRRDHVVMAGVVAAAAVGSAAGAVFALGPARSPDVHVADLSSVAGAPPVPAGEAALAAALFTPPPPITVFPEPARAAEPPPIDMAHVIHEGALRVVLAARVQAGWLGDPAQMTAEVEDGITIVRRPLSTQGHATFAPQLGAALRLHGGAGEGCLARVVAPVALARFAADSDEVPDPQDAWEVAERAHLIAADLEVIEGDCQGTRWARTASLPAPAPATIGTASAALTRRATEQLRALDAYEEMTDGLQPADRRITVQTVSTGRETLAIATLSTLGCADLQPSLTAIYAVEPDGGLNLVSWEPTFGDIVAAADTDGDGKTELLVAPDLLDQTILRRTGGTYAEESAITLPIFGCRC